MANQDSNDHQSDQKPATPESMDTGNEKPIDSPPDESQVAEQSSPATVLPPVAPPPKTPTLVAKPPEPQKSQDKPPAPPPIPKPAQILDAPKIKPAVPAATPKPPIQPPLIPTATQPGMKQAKSSTGGGIKKLLLVFVLLVVLIAGGGLGIWFLLNRPSEAGPVTITYWGLWEPESVMQPLFDQFMQANPDITIKYVNNSTQEYRQRLMNQLNAENPEVDVFRFHNTWVPMLRDHLSLMPETVFTVEEFENTFYPIMNQDLKSGAALVAVPLMYDGLGLFYNEDLFIAGGQQPPTNWRDFRAVALNLTVKDEKRNIEVAGAAMGLTANVDHWPDIMSLLMYQGGSNPALPLANPKATQEALTFYTIFTRVDKVWDVTLPSSTELFAAGKLAMYFAPSWRIHTINNLAKENGVNLRFKVVPVPQLEETNVTWATYWAEGVSNKSSVEKQKAAWSLLAYLAQKDVMEQLYQLQDQERGIGVPYSRVGLADQINSHPQLGAFVLQAPASKTWYLTADTTDKGGINDRIIKYYQDAVNQAGATGVSQRVLKTLDKGIGTVLSEYGVSR